MALIGILLLLMVLCMFIGWIAYIVGGFRVSPVWGLILLLPTFASVAGYFLNLTQTTWFAILSLVLTLPWLVFLFMHWDKAKTGFLLYVAGIIFFAAAVFSLTPELKQQAAAMLVARSGQQLPPEISEFLGIKPVVSKIAVPGAKGAAPGPGTTPDASAPVPKASPVEVATAVVTPPLAGGGLETQAQVTAALTDLNDQSKKLMARKEALKNSTDQPALYALAEDIKVFNARIKLVTGRQAELSGSKSATSAAPAPTATPAAASAPSIPPVVVLPAPTPGPSPKKK